MRPSRHRKGSSLSGVMGIRGEETVSIYHSLYGKKGGNLVLGVTEAVYVS